MARYTGPKHKRTRREGVNLTGTTSARLTQRLGVPPGPPRRRGRPSDYALRLRAKQRVKHQYGMLQRAFRRYVEEASRMPGETGHTLLQLLEWRLVLQRGFEIGCHAAHQPCMEGGQHDGPDRDHAHDGLGD